MFTGIIREIGTVVKKERNKGLVKLAISAPKTASLVEPLESVSINGTCLTVVSSHRGNLIFEMIPETQKLTSLGALKQGSRVNVEPSLSLSDRINGHIVLGHIDGMGKVMQRRWKDGELELGIRVPSVLRRLIVPKGPITVDGVSLTVGLSIRNSTFTVHLIPETLRQTTLELRAVKDSVNIELDYFAKLVWEYQTKK